MLTRSARVDRDAATADHEQNKRRALPDMKGIFGGLGRTWRYGSRPNQRRGTASVV
ncbi:hypothetical protein SBA1_640008 [Candidatus Sulfotelmatobacter kueseliae]|uniref:Uncharacterized protein n=1 Tax=Candidatus Sulfotelmatobacter kueseliae TaxID=2042962 RepID=A0A2U3L2Y0_9BACT|nr:hypothetical protein SBA1_640008 [Candidatus Sulfotelmatobacter kueseliae]